MTSDFGITTIPASQGREKIGLFAYQNAPNCIPGVQTITINVTTHDQGWDIESAQDLTSLSFPNLVSITGSGQFTIQSNVLLTGLSLPVYLPRNGMVIACSGNALNASSVNQILARCVANAAYITGTVSLNGGTNAAPSGQGVADKATLIGRGVTVNTN